MKNFFKNFNENREIFTGTIEAMATIGTMEYGNRNSHLVYFTLIPLSNMTALILRYVKQFLMVIILVKIIFR